MLSITRTSFSEPERGSDRLGPPGLAVQANGSHRRRPCSARFFPLEKERTRRRRPHGTAYLTYWVPSASVQFIPRSSGVHILKHNIASIAKQKRQFLTLGKFFAMLEFQSFLCTPCLKRNKKKQPKKTFAKQTKASNSRELFNCMFIPRSFAESTLRACINAHLIQSCERFIIQDWVGLLLLTQPFWGNKDVLWD